MKYFEIKKIIFKNHAGNTFSILNLFRSLEIYESLYSSTVTGVLTLHSKGAELSSIMRAIGGEHLKIEVINPSDKGLNEIEYNFLILKPAESKSYDNFHISEFQLVTPEYVANKMSAVVKTYTDTAHNVASAVYNDYVVANLGKLPYGLTPPTIVTHPTVGVFKTTYTSNKAYDAIDYLTNMAKSANGDYDYVFFQTVDKMFFVSIRDYLKKQGVFGKYTQVSPFSREGLNTLKEKDLNFHPREIIDFNVESSFDFMQGVNNGTLATKRISMNYYTQDIETELKTYKDAAKDKMDDFNSMDLDFPFEAFQDTKPIVLHTKWQNDKIQDPDHAQHHHVSQTTHLRNMQMRMQLEGTVVTMKLPGAKYLNPGKIIECEFLPNEQTKKQNILSGKYLITKTRHVYSDEVDNAYYTYVTGVKDSYNEA